MNVLKYIKILLLIVLFSALAACGGAEARKDKYLKMGKQYLQQNNLEKARLEFRNVLQIDPKSSQGYFYMGQLDEKVKNFRKALGNYNKAVELKPDYVDAMVGAARIYLVAGAPDKALDLSEKALGFSSTNIDVLAVRAGALYQTDEKEQAITVLENNLKVDPDHLASLSLLSRIYLVTNQVETIEPLLTDSLDRNPENISLIVLLVQVYSDDKQYERAAQLMEKLIRQKPETLSYRLRQAYLLEKTGDQKQALLVLQKAVQDLPENMFAKKNLIQYIAENFGIEHAQQTLKKFIESEDSPELQLVSATLYIKAKEIEKAQSIYRDVIRVYGNEVVAVNAQYALTRLLLSEHKKAEAEEVLAALLKNNPDHNEGLILRGRLALAQKDATGAISDFRTVQKDLLDSPKLMALLADAYVLDGQVELAQEQLKRLLLIEPKNANARLVLAKMYFQQKQFDNVLEQLAIVLQILPGNPQAQELQFKAYLSLRDYAQATQLAQRVEKQQPQSALGLFYQGLVLQAQNKLSDSLERFDKALQVKPNAAQPLGAYVSVALAMKKPELAENKLTSILKQQADNQTAQNLLGEVFLKRNQNSAAASAFEKAIKIDKTWWLPYRNLAVAQLNLQLSHKALETYRQGYESTHQSERLLVLYANQLLQQKKSDEAIAVYEAHLQKQPASSQAANNLAVLLVEYRDDDSAKARAISLVKSLKKSHNAGYMDTLGWVHYKRGEYDQAISALLKADKILPQQPIIYYHLGKTYMDKGDKLSAQKYLQKVADSSAQFKGREDALSLLLVLDKA